MQIDVKSRPSSFGFRAIRAGLAIGAIALIATGCSTKGDAQERGQATATVSAPVCATTINDTSAIDPRLIVPRAHGSEPFTCAPGTRGPAETRLVSLSTKSGVTIGIGRGGQIYSITVPGIAGDLIPMRRADAPFVDGVLQTVATNKQERRESPRGAAIARGGNDRGSSWNYHQAGAYQRGVLAGKPPVYSPIVYERLDARAGVFETLTLAVQAHPSDVPGDRFFAYSRLRNLGDDVIELTQGWINNSRNAFGEAPTLDYFNLPYLTLNTDALPRIDLTANGATSDISAAPWPAPRDNIVTGATWLGGYSGPGAAARGIGIVFGNRGGDTLRFGGRSIRAVADAGGGETDQGIFIVSDIHASDTIQPGEGVFATTYLVFGTRDAVTAKARALAMRSETRTLRIAPTTGDSDRIALCGTTLFSPCAATARGQVVLADTICTDCLPVFDLRQGKTQVLSTEPYLGALTGRYLSDPKYRITRIVGWLYPATVVAPPGYTAVPVRTGSGLIQISAADSGRFHYLTPR